MSEYRIIYTVDDDVLLVAVVRLGHRRDAYEARSEDENRVGLWIRQVRPKVLAAY